MIILFFLLIIPALFLSTSDDLSPTYARSASTFRSPDQYFYAHNNRLYFVEERLKSVVIRYSENNVIHTFAEIPKNYQQFLMFDESTAVVQVQESLSLVYADGSLQELWPGSCVGIYENRLYFTEGTSLYSAHLPDGEPKQEVCFEELLGSSRDGIVYRTEDGIFQLLLNQPNVPRLLTDGEISWPEDTASARSEDLYTSDYAVRIGSNTLDLYFYETGEMRRIFEDFTEGRWTIMAVVAGETELYVSRQWATYDYYPKKNKEINGTYRYSIETDSWSKISDKVCSTMVQYDPKTLYGYNFYGYFNDLKRIEVN